MEDGVIPTLGEITDVEAEYCSATGKPTLGHAYAMLRARLGRPRT